MALTFYSLMKNDDHNPLDRVATEAVLESISDGVFTVDHAWRITSFNRAAEAITGVPREEALGKPCSEVFKAGMCETECALKRTMDSGEEVINRSTYIIDSEGRKVPISVSTALLIAPDGKVVGGVETFRDLSLVEELKKELAGRFQMGDIVSRSPAMAKVFELIPRLAESDSTTLITGETGTGKELLARAIHNIGPRKDRPFVAVNCAAFPDTLLESELFGYKAGAFTGAERDKPGRFALAKNGTIFLDEIGDISAALQAKLLRILQDGTYEPLGSTKSETADARVLAATNRDLEKMVEEGRFREDLYYRINVIGVHLPPLRKRKEDVPLLVEHFIERFNRRQGKAIKGVSPDALAALMSHDYPGNVRELENMIEHAFVLAKEGEIGPEHLPDELAPRLSSPESGMRLRRTKKAVEAQAIKEALERNDFNRLATARELGIHKTTLFRKIREFGISLPDRDGRSRRR